MVSEITISKGSYSVTLYATDIAENFTNKIFVITGATSNENQSGGPSDPKIVDLLRITHQFVIKCYITGTSTKTNKEVKEELIEIYEGAGINGGTTSLVYDGDTFEGYIEKLNIVEKAEDNISTTIKDYARYELAVTFVEGDSIWKSIG